MLRIAVLHPAEDPSLAVAETDVGGDASCIRHFAVDSDGLEHIHAVGGNLQAAACFLNGGASLVYGGRDAGLLKEHGGDRACNAASYDECVTNRHGLSP